MKRLTLSHSCDSSTFMSIARLRGVEMMRTFIVRDCAFRIQNLTDLVNLCKFFIPTPCDNNYFKNISTLKLVSNGMEIPRHITYGTRLGGLLRFSETERVRQSFPHLLAFVFPKRHKCFETTALMPSISEAGISVTERLATGLLNACGDQLQSIHLNLDGFEWDFLKLKDCQVTKLAPHCIPFNLTELCLSCAFVSQLHSFMSRIRSVRQSNVQYSELFRKLYKVNL